MHRGSSCRWWLLLWFMAGLALPLPSHVSIAQTTVPDALLQRFKQTPIGPAETSQFAPAPLEFGRRDLSLGAPFTTEPAGVTGEETSRLELAYTKRIQHGAPDLDRFAPEVPEVERFVPEVSEVDRFAPEVSGIGRAGPEPRGIARPGLETPEFGRVGRVPSDIDSFGRVTPELPIPLVRQFGYRMLGNLGVADGLVTPGAINDNYRLGIGDELIVTFRGQNNQSYRTRVDREGRVVLPDMTPLPAAGLTFGAFRAELKRMASATFLQTEAFVSLGTVRNFPVMVLGAVHRPGVHRLAGVATVLDAIVVAGGVQKTGSLRRIKIIRGTQNTPVDLYDLLLTGELDEDLSIMEGDRVFVPPLGDTIAVAGEVKRPGIYELDAITSGLTVAEAVGLAGGTLESDGYRYLRLSRGLTGGDDVAEVSEPSQEWLENGDILLVVQSSYAWKGAFFLDGHVSVPGPRALNWDRTVGSVFADPDVLQGEPYLLLAALETADRQTLARHFVPVDLARIMAGKSDVPLSVGDSLIVLGADDIRFLSSQSVQAVIAGQGVEQNDCKGLHALAVVVSRSQTERFGGARLALDPAQPAVAPGAEPCPDVFNRHPTLLPFLLDLVVAVRGEVRNPGLYPVMTGTSLGSLVPVAGGLASDADPGQIEVTQFAPEARGDGSHSTRRTIDARSSSLLDVALVPGDIVRFNPRFSDRDVGGVVLSGEFRRPGVYAIRRGERLSDIIHRVGGLTEQAYPLGAVFTRIRVRQQEAKAFERAALDLESGLAEALARTEFEAEESTALVAAVRGLAETLRTTTPVGRVSVEADPTVLEVRPELDTILEPGDSIHMPKRPNHVTVSGEVLSPGTIQFRTGKRADDYVASAGGITRAADDGRTFVILPNGEARPVSVSTWNFTPVHIPPGSTIVVPRDPKPFELLAFSSSITDLLSKLAISAASLVVIGG